MLGDDLEKKISKWHFRLELIRTCVPVCVLFLQVIIFLRLFHLF